ncbi:putative D-mandelate dehydrogenase [Pseudomassariella vexata]|uniref:Putative D-mandelate dehydrogenase n=1 Tax=Pseudomassariella vexata TaxID=1141098 RepID=A0A1Y2DVZ1_9PEZI|nr:putative D-mandelate dehydrogenase [Pseudomassariella vexata]ORY63460.1 putative D-mandelate dehydrogenase [Pseudomassariella vexata]
MPSATKPTVLHIGDPIKHNHEIYRRFSSEFTVIRPSVEERQRVAFLRALKENKWGNFDAVFRPFWNTGGEMGRWDQELIPLLPPSVKIYASAGAGYDWADVDIMAEHGILYCNGAAASSEAVADMALFHILSVFRNLTWSHLAARSGDPAQWTDAHKHATMTAHNPRGHTLGVIGLGNIGLTIAQKARAAFGMEILYHDVVRKPAAELDEGKNGAGGGVGAVYIPTLDELLSKADCVVLATPFGGKVLIDRERLMKFKKGARFVNIARGALVDEDALVEVLQSGHIFAAGLDVFQHEPRVHPELCKMRNVTLTSHNAGGAIETNWGFERLAMENIEGLLLKGQALTPVNAHLMQSGRGGK